MILISSLLVAGFLLTSLASYFISVASLRDHVTNNELPLTSDNIYTEIQRDLLKPIFISSLMASDTFLRDWVIRGEQEQTEVTRYLKEIMEKYNAFTAFFVSEKSRNYYHADGLLKQVDPKEQRDAWYFRVRELPSDYEINVDFDMANNDAMTVFVNYRVYDYDGKFIGVTGVGLAVDAVEKLINHYQDTYDRNILFVDQQGGIRLSSAGLGDSQSYLKELERHADTGQLLKEISAADIGSFEYRSSDRTVMFNTRYIKEFGWYLLVVQSEVEGTGELFNTLLINLAACALITLIVLVIINYTISSYQQDIERMATTDKLTGLYNRQALDILFKQLILNQKRHPTKMAAMLFDIDHFKRVNDQYGHLAGDAVLEQIARLTVSRLRETDITCRWGGEEFLVLLKDCDSSVARNMAEELRLSVLNNPTEYQEKKIEATISVGVAEYRADDTRDQLIARVDTALFKAKRGGRNQVAIDD
ncbi:MAG: diguanylate cyclase [Sedimenticola sp.]|nr:diguanylate cyclase [Sedimenticola sp.]